jgi:transposase
MSKLSAELSSVTVVGLDLAKHVFQVHCIDGEGRSVVNRALRRREVLSLFGRLRPCLVGMEACGSAHHWGRELAALGHDVKLMPPAYVKPYVRRQKNDAADAEAICEAVTRPSIRFVEIRGGARQQDRADRLRRARQAGALRRLTNRSSPSVTGDNVMMQ